MFCRVDALVYQRIIVKIKNRIPETNTEPRGNTSNQSSILEKVEKMDSPYSHPKALVMLTLRAEERKKTNLQLSSCIIPAMPFPLSASCYVRAAHQLAKGCIRGIKINNIKPDGATSVALGVGASPGTFWSCTAVV